MIFLFLEQKKLLQEKKKERKEEKNNMNFAFATAMIWLVGHAERSNIKMGKNIMRTHTNTPSANVFFFLSFDMNICPGISFKGMKLRHSNT